MEKRAEITIDAPIERVFDVIVDFERYPEFVPENHAVHVTSTEGDTSTVRFEVEMLMRFDYTVKIEMERPERVSWTLVEGKMLSTNTGSWELEAVDAEHTKAVYTLKLELARAIPAAVRDRLIGAGLPKTLERFKLRAESFDR